MFIVFVGTGTGTVTAITYYLSNSIHSILHVDLFLLLTPFQNSWRGTRLHIGFVCIISNILFLLLHFALSISLLFHFLWLLMPRNHLITVWGMSSLLSTVQTMKMNTNRMWLTKWTVKKNQSFSETEISKLNYGILNVIESSNVRRYGPSTISRSAIPLFSCCCRMIKMRINWMVNNVSM